MYEVGIWFVYLIDFAVLAIFGMIALILIFVKRNQYQKEAVHCIRAEIQLSTGWSEYYTVPCNDNDKSISIHDKATKGDFIYMLDVKRRRYGKHPMNPFMGLGWLQVPIRIETWTKDIPEPLRLRTDKEIIATSAEIKAMTREIQATTAAMQIQEIDARQDELTKAIGNQPSKMIVYILLGLSVLVGIISIFMIYSQIGNLTTLITGG
jgi:hypothetical protein